MTEGTQGKRALRSPRSRPEPGNLSLPTAATLHTPPCRFLRVPGSDGVEGEAQDLHADSHSARGLAELE